jgi:hypothetical protein
MTETNLWEQFHWAVAVGFICFFQHSQQTWQPWNLESNYEVRQCVLDPKSTSVFPQSQLRRKNAELGDLTKAVADEPCEYPNRLVIVG